MKSRLKTRQELITEGKPYIRYMRNGKTYSQVFITEQGCEKRLAELRRNGVKCERIQ